MMVQHVLASALLTCWLVACSGTAGFRDRTNPILPSPPPDTFKVLTYNALHGLDVDRFWVRPGESNEQHEARFSLRIQQIAQAQPDVILLQEVNPLPAMAEDYVQALDKQGLKYAEVHQVDACGLRVPGLAIIPGLNNGLVILAKAPFQLHKLDGVKLSGGPGGCQDSFGIQFGELRYALIAEIQQAGSAMKHLVVSTHLHSGVERDAHFLDDLMEAHRLRRVMRYDQLMAELVLDQERRLMELHTLVESLQQYQTSRGYAGVIIGGDFNFEPGSPEYRELRRLGLEDSATLDPQMPMLNTYDPQRNPLVGHEEEKLPASLTLAIASETSSDMQEIEARYRQSISQARRIDFLFSMSFMPQTCLMQTLFGEITASGLAGSDHYGVLNTYSMKAC